MGASLSSTSLPNWLIHLTAWTVVVIGGGVWFAQTWLDDLDRVPW